MAFAIAISAFNALTLSPALCAILLKPKKGSPEAVGSSFIDRFSRGIQQQFYQTYQTIQEHCHLLCHT